MDKMLASSLIPSSVINLDASPLTHFTLPAMYSFKLSLIGSSGAL